MNFFGSNLTRQELLARACLNPISNNGILSVSTGKFNFLVHPDRGLDISQASYCALPISFTSKNHVDGYKSCFHDSFFGGLLTTCGLENVGQGQMLGDCKLPFHGTYNLRSAENLSISSDWQGDELVSVISGKIRFTRLFAENVVLTRKIITVYGVDEVIIEDEIENVGFKSFDLMLLYHINFGYPFLDENLQIQMNPTSTLDFNGLSPSTEYKTIYPPSVNYTENVYIHTFDKPISATLINKNLCVELSCENLPYLTQWKNFASGDYALAFEPSTTPPLGYDAAKKRGTIIELMPFEKYKTKIKVGIQEC